MLNDPIFSPHGISSRVFLNNTRVFIDARLRLWSHTFLFYKTWQEIKDRNHCSWEP